MKKILGALFVIIIAVILSSCMSLETNIEQESIDSMNDSVFLEKPLDTNCVANISSKELTIESGTLIFAYDGKIVQDRENSYFDVSEYFEEMCKTGTICHQDPVEITLHFLDEVPSKLEWGQYFYRSATEPFSNESTDALMTIEDVNQDMVLQSGNNVSVLFSNTQTEPTYRIIRILCQYKDKQVEYCVIFDGWNIGNE